MHRKVAVAIAAALALVVASCGGTETTTLGRAALVRRVEVACRAAQDASARLARESKRPDPVELFEASQRLLVEKLEGLEASGDAKADFDAYKESIRSRFDVIEKVAAASRADRQRVIRSVQREAQATSTKAEAAARRLGLERCG